jgi:hypothetical protein
VKRRTKQHTSKQKMKISTGQRFLATSPRNSPSTTGELKASVKGCMTSVPLVSIAGLLAGVGLDGWLGG